MKKLAIAIAAIALIGTPAIAADMAVKAPPPPAAPVYNWTGWYDAFHEKIMDFASFVESNLPQRFISGLWKSESKPRS